MKNPWRFFFVVEALLAIFLLWQLSSNPAMLIMLLFGGLNIYFALRKQERRKFQLILGSVIVIICLVNSPATWLMLVFAVLFLGLKGFELAGISMPSHSLKKRKSIVMVDSTEPISHNGERKRQGWIGNERIGTQVFEWDDINISILAGDTLVDLGNTLLPKEDSIVIVRKGFGRTRILVPYGVGLVLEHATLYGKVDFDDEQYMLRNESLKVYSEDYDGSQRRLKIITNTLVGDIEVIRV
ncbi:cell wall-active antibiotics response protein LiaF [Enterococcus hermanniensis]|uniref:cell wall-active antibiotics response protein LiaF n=1 Tax=Enterococcus hermanniensis TaxID=249189 RepID=UPI000900183B|nr:cell wall-active antibiotics response protein LiaF [Enterococcus hermanniensis]